MSKGTFDATAAPTPFVGVDAAEWQAMVTRGVASVVATGKAWQGAFDAEKAAIAADRERMSVPVPGLIATVSTVNQLHHLRSIGQLGNFDRHETKVGSVFKKIVAECLQVSPDHFLQCFRKTLTYQYYITSSVNKNIKWNSLQGKNIFHLLIAQRHFETGFDFF